MMPSICSKAAANISLASDIILSHLGGSERGENQHQFQQKAANTALSAPLCKVESKLIKRVGKKKDAVSWKVGRRGGRFNNP